MLNRETLNAFLALRKAALNLGVDLYIDGGHRTLAYQQELFNRFANEKGLEYAQSIVAPVGTSEHHTGLAIDLTLEINGIILEDNDDLFKNSELFEKIYPFLASFGFILRYPKGKEDITGYDYEPWHIRYIGREFAMDMKANDITTLEEYLNEKRSR